MTLFRWLAGLEGLGAEVCEKEPERVTAGVEVSKGEEEAGDEGIGILSGRVDELVYGGCRESAGAAEGYK